MTSAKKRILVVLDPAVGEEAAVRAMLEREAAELHRRAGAAVHLAWLTNDDGDATAAAEQQIDHALNAAAVAGLAAAARCVALRRMGGTGLEPVTPSLSSLSSAADA